MVTRPYSFLWSVLPFMVKLQVNLHLNYTTPFKLLPNPKNLWCPSWPHRRPLGALPSILPLPLTLPLPRVERPQVRNPLPLLIMHPWNCTTLVCQTHCLHQPLYQLFTDASDTATAYTTIAISLTATIIYMLSNILTLTILFLQDFTANEIIPFIHMMTYEKSQDTPRL